MEIIGNLDLLALGAAVAAVGIIGFTVFFSDRSSATNRAFLLFSVVTIFWSIFNYINYQVTNPVLVLWLLRVAMFFAVWHAFTFFHLFYTFPNRRFSYSRWYKALLIPTVAATSLATLTPYIFSEIAELSEIGSVSKVVVEPGIILFAVVILVLIFSAFVLLTRRTIESRGIEKKQYILILLGTIITFSLLIIFNFILPAFFLDVRFIPLGGLFILPFASLTAYSIIRHKFLEAKVIAAQILVFLLSMTSLLEVIFASTRQELIFRSSIFLLILTFSILLVRSVIHEVEQREEIQTLAEHLKRANERLKDLDKLKSEFLSIASHQLRSPLTAIGGYASMILEGSFGKVSDSVGEAVKRIMTSSAFMRQSVEDFLNVSRIEQGRMKYDMSDFDLGELVQTVIDEMKPLLVQKPIKLVYNANPQSKHPINADLGKIKQVLLNVIDNAIKYTPRGTIAVDINHDSKRKTEIVTIKDSGVGFSEETKKKMFGMFTRAKNASRVNVSGTGVGLYVARKLIEAHGGSLDASSEGEGKGSTFTIELKAR